MELFIRQGNYVIPSIHALMRNPWKRFWEQDHSEDKVEAEKIMRYAEFMCSPKESNTFYGIDEEIRGAKVKKEVWGDEKLPTTSDMIEAVLAYKEQLSEEAELSYSMLEAAEGAAYKVRDYLKTINPALRTGDNGNGALVIKPKEILLALQEVPKTMEDLKRAKGAVQEELKNSEKTRNNRQAGEYEE